MIQRSNNLYFLLADAFGYPAPGLVSELKDRLKALPEGTEGVKTKFQAFLDRIARLSLGEWEELHTRTLDLDPPAAPYVGFQTWGDSYRRGVFLAKMKQELAAHSIDLKGELPDHLAPVLRYLGHAAAPLPELIDVLPRALQRMLEELSGADPGNPYLDLLEAALLACKDFKKEAA